MKSLRSLRLSIVLLSAGVSVLAPIAIVRAAAKAAESAAQKTARYQIAASYQKINAAALRADVKTILGFYAPDYTQHSRRADGYRAFSRSEAEQIARMIVNQNPYPGVTSKLIKSQSKILSLTWRGPDAIVVVQNTGVNVMQQNGRSLRMEIVHTSRDYWSRVGGTWKVRQSVEREVSGWVNGRRVNVFTNPF